MNERHIIEKTTWDISFGSEEDAFAQQAALGDFARSRMLATVDEVFDEMSTAGQVFRIDRLEIDLGAVAYNDFQQELDQRLRERLRAALQTRLQTLKVAPAPNEGVITKQDAELAQIEYFLTKGHLPWNANPADDRNLDQMLQGVIDASAARLAQFLRTSSRRVAVIRRLVHQFPDPILGEIVRVLVPPQAHVLASLINDLQKIDHQNGLLQLSRRDLVHSLWQELLMDLLQTPAAVLNPRTVIGRMLKKIFQRRGENYYRMLTLLVDAALALERRAGLNPELIGLLEALLENERPKPRPMTAAVAPGATRDQGAYPPPAKQAVVKKAMSSTATAEAAPITYLREQLAMALKRGSARGITYFWPMLLRNRPKLLDETIRYYGRRAAVRKKIATGFPTNMLKDIVRLLEPAASSFIEAVVDRPQLFQQAPAEPPQEAGRLKRRLWEFTLTYLLVERGSRFNKKSYMGSLMQQMAAHDNIHYRGLLSSLTDVLEEIAVPNPLKIELLQLLGDLRGEADSRSKPAGSDPGAHLPRSAEIESLRSRLADAILRGNARGLREVWPTLLNEQSDLLEGVLRHYGRQAELRKKMTQGFSESMLMDMVHLIEPAAGSFIQEVVARPQLFKPTGGTSPEHSSSPKQQLWEFTLAYLLAERGSRFNKEVYMGGLVQKMASHNNLRYCDLLVSMTRVLQKMEAPNVFKQELLQLLVGLADELGGPPPDRSIPASQSRQVIRSYDLFDGLKRFWQSDNLAAPGSAVDPTKIIDELARAYPEQLLRLYRELQAGHLPLSTVVARLPIETLGRLLMTFIALNKSDGRNRPSDFLRAVETFAGRARNRRRFYRQVLEQLISGQIVDFENILAADRVAPEKNSPVKATFSAGGTPKAQNPSGEPTKDALPTGDRALDALAAYLKDSHATDTAAKTRLIHVFELLIVQHPQRLRRLLAEVLGRRETAARIIDLLPERLLTRLLFLTHSAEHGRIQQAADAIANACRFKAFGIPGDRLHRLKWHFIFKFLFEESRSSDETTFVQDFAAYLASQSNFADMDKFQKQLIGRLHANHLPSTRQRHLSLIEALSPTGGQTLAAEPDLRTTALPGDAGLAEDEEQAFSEEIYIDNAGLVLTSPYLPRLFAMLDLTAESAFKNHASAERAVHLLQFMVYAGTDSPEYQLVLNKILCGVKTGIPIVREIDIRAREQETLEGLLQAMIANWKSIGNTTVAGLRESFLQREGRLRLKDDAWHLLVEPRAYDMLLDRLPWGFATIKHPWMERVVHVNWR